MKIQLVGFLKQAKNRVSD